MVSEKPQKLSPKGEAVLDAILDWIEDNIDEAARGLELILEKLHKEGKWPPKAKG